MHQLFLLRNLGLLLLAAYLSHLVSFVILSGSIVVIVLSSGRENRLRNAALVFAAFVPILPLLVLYKFLSSSGGGFSPVWRFLGDNWSVWTIVNQLRACDPFVLISHKSLPFSDLNTPLLAIFSPTLWIFAAYLILVFATIRNGSKNLFLTKSLMPFVLLFLGSIVMALFGPDDFGISNGGLLRERVLLCGLCFIVPFFRINLVNRWKRVAQICLIFVVIFQTAAIWEYSLETDAKAKELGAASAALEDGDSLASVVIVEHGMRFRALPEPNIDTLVGVGRNILIWDDYELGYYLVPVIAKNDDYKQFIYELSVSHAYIMDDPRDDLDEKISRFEKCMKNNHEKIRTMMFIGKNDRYEQILQQWFEREPFFEKGVVRMFHHKVDSSAKKKEY